MLEELIRRHKSTHVIVAFDPPPPVFRHLLYPQYKAGRPDAPYEFLIECEELRDRLNEERYTTVEKEDYEADDVIGSLCKLAEDKHFTSVIATCDLDLLQLVNGKTAAELFSQYHKMRSFDIEKTVKRFGGLEPYQIPDYKALAGDKSDNLPGVPGIGNVSATILLNELKTVEGIYAEISSVISLPLRGAERIHSILDKNKEQAFLMKKLTTIVCDLEIDVDIEKSTNPLLSAAELILS